MTPFSEAESHHFFGRDDEVEEMLQLLRVHPFLAVIGPSGSGKSSLVTAGLMPALRRSALFQGGEWLIRTVRPGEAPMTALSTALAGDPTQPGATVPALLADHPGAARLLLFVDQLEEVFTVAVEGAGEFQSALAALIETGACWVVTTVRADFYPQLMTSPSWQQISRHRLEVLPLEGNRLRPAIVRPAESVGVFVETALVERLVADAAHEPGALPLVQETMVCLWERLERKLLPLSAYDEIVLPYKAYGGGSRTGLQVAMARRADAAMDSLSPSRQVIARRMLLRLVQFGEGRSDVRRQQPVSGLRAGAEDDKEFEQVLEHLVSRRLLTITAGAADGARRADLAHEALIAGWPSLQEWLVERREGEQTRRRLVEKSLEWIRLGAGTGGLLDQVEQLEAERWLGSADAPDLGVDDEIVRLVAASRTAIDQQARREEADRQLELDQANTLAAEQQARAHAERRRADDQARSRTSCGDWSRPWPSSAWSWSPSPDTPRRSAAEPTARPASPARGSWPPCHGRRGVWTGPCCWARRPTGGRRPSRPGAACSPGWSATLASCATSRGMWTGPDPPSSAPTARWSRPRATTTASSSGTSRRGPNAGGWPTRATSGRSPSAPTVASSPPAARTRR